MGKTTQFVKVGKLFSGFAFFSFILLTASNTAPTELIISEKDSGKLAIATEVAKNISTQDMNLSSPSLNSTMNSEDIACIVTAPAEIKKNTSFDGTGDCSAVLNDIGTATAVGCTEITATPYVNGEEIDPAIYAFQLGITVVEWRATDPITGNLITDDQLVTISDDEKPMASDPAPINVQCSADVPAPDISIVTDEADNCTTSPTVTFVGDVSDNNSNPEVITRTYRITDEAGNYTDVEQTITIDDTINPTASDPAPINVQCSADVPAPDISVVTDEADNCTTSPIVTFVGDVSDNNSNPKVITRNYRVTDEAGNSIDVEQTITVDDTINPTASDPAPINVQCSADVPAPDISIVTDEADNCTTSPTVTFVGDVSDNNSNPEVITRTYRVTDEAGNSTDVEQIITVDDTINPTASDPAPINVQCSADVPTPDISVVTDEADNCTTSPIVTFVSDVSDNNSNPEVITRIYRVTDEAGNSIDVEQTITVDDTINPTASDPAPINVQCSADVPAYDISVVTDEADNCTTSPIVTFVSDVSDNNSNPEVITRTYRVTDEAGNSTDVEQTITVDDTIKPTASDPAPINVQCSADVPAPDISVVTDEADNCTTSPTVTFVGDVSDNNSNPEVITRTYRVTDEAGNSTDVEQTITVDDTINPTASDPAPINVQCSADVPAPDISVVTDEADNCTTSPTVTFVGDVSDNNSNPEVITRTYRITDEAGNYTDIQQTITIDDTTNPTITAPSNVTEAFTSADGTGDCFTAVSLGSPTFSDNCTTPTLKAYVNGSPINPSTHLFPKGTTTITWEVTDGSNNKATTIQTVTVQDDENPVIESPSPVTAYTSEDGTGNCSTTAMIGFPAIKDNCNTVSTKAYIGNTEINPELYEFPVGSTTVTWIARDAGGLTSSADQVVTVIDDEDPIPNDLNTINWGCSFTVPTPTATDNCDETLTVTANRSTTFDSSGVIVWTFTDDRGNSSTAEQTININPMTTTVSSTRTTVYGKNDGTATVNLSGGISPYTYEWRLTGSPTIVSTAKEATNLAAGIYEVTVIDVNGCKTIEQVEVISAVLPEHVASSACYDVHDYIRTSTFEIDLPNVAGGVGDPQNFTYEWNFGLDASPNTATGPQEHTVTWEAQGDKIVYLTITDESDYKQTFSIPHYVGGCFEGCGATSNFVMDTNNFFIGDEFGNPLTGDNCDSVTDKYMWIDIINNANGYSLSAEMNYAVNNGTETITGKAIGCFSEVVGYDNQGDPVYNEIPTGLFRLFKVQESGTATDMITWQCGSTFKVEGINIRWTNQDTRGCNEGTKPMCYGPETEVIVKTPLVVDATPEDVLCKEESTGSITVHAAGGLKPYQYSLLSGPVTRPYQDSEYFYNLPAGEYTFSAKDADTIITTGTVVISEPATKVSATLAVSSEITCYGGTGTATVTPSGGVSPYTYSWSSGHTTATADNLLAGITYTVTVTDANSCKITKELILTQPAQLTRANAGIDQSFGCGITSTTLAGNLPATGEKGTWSLVSGTGGALSSTDLNDPNAPFTGESGQTYVLQWTISKTDGTCPNSDRVSITFAEKCSTLNFDGIDDHVVMGDQYGFTSTDFTLEAWVRPKSVNGTKTILSKRNTGNMASGGYDLDIINGAVSFRWNDNKVYTTAQVGTDRWYHVAVIFSEGIPEIFVDGISIPLQLDIAASGNPKAINHPFMIGGAYYQNSPERPKNLFHGWIEEVRLWKTALSVEQLRFMMNQRVVSTTNALGETVVKGEVLPMAVPGDLLWTDLSGYYRLKVLEIDAVNGTTPDFASNPTAGYLRNIEEEQENSAPLPYISAQDGNWWEVNSWLYPDYWDAPNSNGINGQKIDWNIARVAHDLNSGNQNIKLLGLILKNGKLDMLGVNQSSVGTAGTGNGLTVTKFLDLDGFIDLNGESQLVQPQGSILVGNGYLERDQQGTGSSYNYNYFSSPVSTAGGEPNSGYTIRSVLRSGSDPANPGNINFNYQYHYADGPLSDPLKISSYWLYKFHGVAGEYNQWHWIGPDGHLQAGEGFTMKGSSGHLGILDLQNYVFTGMPNNGPISFTIDTNENRLIGNPYPSAIDADMFIQQNLKNKNEEYVFNGTLYFWSHFKGKTHYLTRYEGGYAMYNLLGAARAVANDARINATGETGGMEPRRYIPPGQAFFINSAEDDQVPNDSNKLPLPVGMVGGEIQFNNNQRVFQKEDPAKAVFHSKEKPNTPDSKNVEVEAVEEDSRKKIWLKSRSPMGYHRQLLVGADNNATLHFDPGYDAPVLDIVDEDMYWDMEQMELIIQGVPDFHKEVELPLGLKVKHEGDFTIGIDKLENIPDDFAILLKDTLGNEHHDLRRSNFTFTASPGTINGRFSIVFLNEKQDPEEILEEEKTIPVELFYSREDKTVNIHNPDLIPLMQAALYNLNGQHLRTYGYLPAKRTVQLAIPQKTLGVYILRLETAQGIKTLKFLID